NAKFNFLTPSQHRGSKGKKAKEEGFHSRKNKAFLKIEQILC
ncbi:MAG: hypothetical protein RLY64_102, partial [Bacteroidota bacterium]